MDTSHRILVVCEDTITLERMGTHLGEQGLDVQCAENLRDALRYAEAWGPELVICEYVLGGMRGPELSEAIRQVVPKARFIMITSPGETPEYARAGSGRVVAFLGKPFNPEDLMHFVHGAFSAGDSQFNRREHSRHSFTIEAQLTLINPFDDSESRTIAALVRDVSRSGLTLIVRQILPVPAMLRVIFHLAGQQYSIPLLAKSISCTFTQIPGVFRLGAKFIGLLPGDLESNFINISTESLGGEVKDIFMGRSFKEAALDWLEQHPDAVGSDSGEPTTPRVLSEIAEEFAPDSHDKA